MRYVKTRTFRLLLLTLIVAGVFFGTTDPAKVSPLWLIIGFILAVASIYWLFRGLTAVLGLYFEVLKNQRRRLTVVLTVLTAILLGLESMGQLSLRDFIVLIPLMVLSYFYTRYNRRTGRSN